MKSLHYTTASIYSFDYRRYDFLRQSGTDWKQGSCGPKQLLAEHSCYGLQCNSTLGDTDPRLSEGVRLSVFLEQSPDRSTWTVAATVTGLRSMDRKDFNGRRIRDGLHVMAKGSSSNHLKLQEACQVVSGLSRLAFDSSISMDAWCSLPEFENDQIPFPSPEKLWQHLKHASRLDLQGKAILPHGHLGNWCPDTAPQAKQGLLARAEKPGNTTFGLKMLNSLKRSFSTMISWLFRPEASPSRQSPWIRNLVQANPEASIEDYLTQLWGQRLPFDVVLIQFGRHGQPLDISFHRHQPRSMLNLTDLDTDHSIEARAVLGSLGQSC